jgi:hypothetical protein
LYLTVVIAPLDAFAQDEQTKSSEELFNRGAAIYHGYSAEADRSTGCGYFAEAAARNHAKAIFNLGNCYRDGDLGTVDLDRAEELYVQAAGMGVADAFVSLGVLQLNSADDPDDYRTANQYFRIALYSDPSDAIAGYHYGVSLLLGRGAQQNRSRAIDLIDRSSESGYIFALATMQFLACNSPETIRDGEEMCEIYSSEYEFVRINSNQSEPSYEETISYLMGKGWLPKD